MMPPRAAGLDATLVNASTNSGVAVTQPRVGPVTWSIRSRGRLDYSA
ncbi:hypothetical protein NJ7G_1549 [Natrinema sp. J7-2]|nr:hypothetical protein NJ7G_1549 [Natrinema sp. J7-2]